jgi:hypothetical protein
MRINSRWSAVCMLLLASCGGGDSGVAVPVPVVTLSAAPTTVANSASSTLTWTSTNATTCTASGSWSGAIATSGTHGTGALSAAATYAITCAGPGGTGPTVSTTVNVVPTATLAASAPTVAAGSPIVLTWSSANATTCEASGGWTGTKAVSGVETIAALAVNTTYSMICSGAGGASVPVTSTVNVIPNAVLTASASVVAAGGTAVLTWSSANATACSASGGWSGAVSISGSQSTGPLTVPTTYSLTCNGAGGTSNTATVSIQSGSVSIAPAIAAVTLTQPQQFTATVPGGGAATWMVDGIAGGNGTVGSIGSAGLYTPGTAAGAHTITATSVAYPILSGTAVAAVTDLAAVTTYHDDVARDGANTHEFALSPSSVASGNFGKVYSCTVDGAIYAQPLWVAGLTINGARHNVVFVATGHDSLYAFDADASPCAPLWTVSLIDAAHGAAGGETPVPDGAKGYLVGQGQQNLAPEIGVTGTPVIDPASGTLYAVSKSVNAAQTVFYQRLHAIDLATGTERPGAPATIGATYPGNGDGGTSVAFNPRTENQRAALALVNGVVYVTWASHEDVAPWYGWVIGYSYAAGALGQVGVFNTAPDAQYAGIWMSGGGPAADAAGNLYLITGNGPFDATSATAPKNDYGDSLLQLTGGLGVSQYFTPSDQAADAASDKDFGAGGAAVLADLPATSPVMHLLLCGGKDGTIYLLNRDALGGLGDAGAVQKAAFGYRIFATGAFWNGNYYLSGDQGPLAQFALTAAQPQITLASSSTHGYGFGGSTPSISAAGSQDGIVWTLDNANFCTGNAPACGPTVLYAHDATNLANELWNSGARASDAAGYAIKFTVPTVANGHVYVGTRGNNTGGAPTSTSIAGELDVYGFSP